MSQAMEYCVSIKECRYLPAGRQSSPPFSFPIPIDGGSG